MKAAKDACSVSARTCNRREHVSSVVLDLLFPLLAHTTSIMIPSVRDLLFHYLRASILAYYTRVFASNIFATQMRRQSTTNLHAGVSLRKREHRLRCLSRFVLLQRVTSLR